MSNPSKRRILVVDDEASMRESLAMLLTLVGYGVTTAKDGFDALLQIKRSLPDVIVSDLNMPQMSGFEFLSVVRRRFPQILVVAMSGAYGGDAVPDGIIADAFYAKGGSHVETLLSTVADLIQTSVARAHAHRTESAPVWIPRNGKDSDGVPYIVLTCTECLRSFPLNVTEEANPEVQETLCLFCPNKVRYIIDFSRSVVSPQKTLGDVLYADKSRARVSEDEWVELVRAVAGGDQRALHYLYGQMSRIVFTLVLRIIKNRETAEEVTVNVFYDVWRRASTYDPGNGSVAGWIMNQARCRAIDRLRFDQRKKRVNKYPDSLGPVTDMADPQQACLFEEQRDVLQNALAVLSPEERKVIETAFFSELTYEETAQRLAQPLGTVKTRIRSGLKKLRAALAERRLKAG